MALESGGFFPLSPPASTTGSISVANATLPAPRSSPLRSGGAKESAFIRHADREVLRIQRRFNKRTEDTGYVPVVTESDEHGRVIQSKPEATSQAYLPASERWSDVTGYRTFGEAWRDVVALVQLVWISGTPSLQIPYLINIASLVNAMIPAFPASPRQMFALLSTLDHAFASLLQQRDIDTGHALPGFGTGMRVNDTDKVRIRSLVQRTRVAVMNVMSKGEIEEEDTSTLEQEDDELVLDDTDDANTSDWTMQTARVYDQTLVELGESLDGPSIGLRTE